MRKEKQIYRLKYVAKKLKLLEWAGEGGRIQFFNPLDKPPRALSHISLERKKESGVLWSVQLFFERFTCYAS